MRPTVHSAVLPAVTPDRPTPLLRPVGKCGGVAHGVSPLRSCRPSGGAPAVIARRRRSNPGPVVRAMPDRDCFVAALLRNDRGGGSAARQKIPSLADAKRAGRQGDVQRVQLTRLQPRQILRGFQEAVRLARRDHAVGQRGELADVVVAAERFGAERMRVRHRQLIDDAAAVLHHHLDAAAERLLGRIGGEIAALPLRILARLDLVPKPHGVGAAGAARRVAVDVVPAPVLQRDGEDVHDRVVERLARGLRVHLLRIVGAGADHGVRVVTGVDDDLLDLLQIGDLPAHAERQVDQRLRLILGAVLLGEAVEDRALRLARRGQRHLIVRLRPVQQPGDHPVLAFIDRARRAFAAHHAIHRLDRELAGVRGRIGLPRADLALARLARGAAHVHRLLHRLVDHVLLQAEQRADAGGLAGQRWVMWSILCLCSEIARTRSMWIS